jgi:hypothetical protein
MTTYEVYALVAYMIGVVIERFISAEVGSVIRIIAAVVFVLAWLISVIHP